MHLEPCPTSWCAGLRSARSSSPFPESPQVHRLQGRWDLPQGVLRGQPHRPRGQHKGKAGATSGAGMRDRSDRGGSLAGSNHASRRQGVETHKVRASSVSQQRPAFHILRFQALPRVPILMPFNHHDEDFPAQCSLLFENKTDKHLDMECLAMMGWVLAAWLRSGVKGKG
jgi:hypothetical protein